MSRNSRINPLHKKHAIPVRTVPYSLAFVFWSHFAINVSAQSLRDKITFLNPDTGSRARVACTILDHTGEYIRYQMQENGPTTVRRSAEVVTLETAQTKPHREGLMALSKGKTKEAITLLEEGMKQESRGWVRRDILAMLVKCALRQENYSQAGSRFLLITDSDKTTHHFRGIPLLWTSSPPSAEHKAAALGWATRADPAAKLLAASALLFDPKYQGSSESDLKRLTVNLDERVRSLATAQLWRVNIRQRKLDQPMLTGWQAAIDAMPKEIRGGPYFVLGEARKQRREYDWAAAALLWVPLVYDYDYQLSAQACLSGAESLNAIGQREEAAALYREVIVRYGQSSYAQDAAQMLKTLNSPAKIP